MAQRATFIDNGVPAESVSQHLSTKWCIQPTAVIESEGRRAVSAALWNWMPGTDGRFELTGDPQPDMHIVSLCVTGRHHTTYWGDGRVRADTQSGPGNLNIVRAGERPRAFQRCEGRLDYLHIYVPSALLHTASSELGEGASRSLEIVDPGFKRDAAVTAIGREIIAELRTLGPLHRLRIDTLGQDLAIRLIRDHSNLRWRPARALSRGGLAPWQLKRACEAMAARLGDDIGLDMLAGIAGCSPTHFSRAFKQSTGMPPFQWLLERRIERAQALLTDPHMPLAEVALAVGFAAQPQFTTAFRRVTGATPGVWRRERLS